MQKKKEYKIHKNIKQGNLEKLNSNNVRNDNG